MKPFFVIYHRADFDGLFSREIAKKFFRDTAEYVGWDYGDPLPTVPPEVTTIYMIDISINGMMDDRRLVWIDHHKSAMEKFSPTIAGYRIDGVAACRLAWQWFFKRKNNPPTKGEYVNRTVDEPVAVRLAGEYDIWDKRDPRAELFQHGLRSRELTEQVWADLLDTRIPEVLLGTGMDSTNSETMTSALLQAGGVLQFAKTNENASIARQQSFTLPFEGLIFCAINAARYNSFLFTAAIKPEHDALLGFNWDGQKRKWKVSLYHAPGKESHDLSLIAVKYGGGGHRGACGFECATLPFPLN